MIGMTIVNAATPTTAPTFRISSVAYATEDRLSEANTASAVGLPRRSCTRCAVGSAGPSNTPLQAGRRRCAESVFGARVRPWPRSGSRGASSDPFGALGSDSSWAGRLGHRWRSDDLHLRAAGLRKRRVKAPPFGVKKASKPLAWRRPSMADTLRDLLRPLRAISPARAVAAAVIAPGVATLLALGIERVGPVGTASVLPAGGGGCGRRGRAGVRARAPRCSRSAP